MKGADWPRLHLLYCMWTQMFRIEQHSIVTLYEVVSVRTVWWMIFYRCLFATGEKPPGALGELEPMEPRLWQCSVEHWWRLKKKAVVCALYCDNRLCCGANGPTLDPQPTHTGGGVGGIFSNGIKWLDTLLPLGFKHSLEKSKSLLCSPLILLWKAFRVRASAQPENLLACAEVAFTSHRMLG